MPNKLNYDKLFTILESRKIKTNHLVKDGVLTAPTMAKLLKGKNVYTDVLIALCNHLDCKLEDIVEYVPSKNDAATISPEPIESSTNLSVETESEPDSSIHEADTATKNESPDNDSFILSKSGFYYQKSVLERDRINLPHKFETNAKYPYICPETGYAYRITDFGAFERLDDPEK